MSQEIEVPAELTEEIPGFDDTVTEAESTIAPEESPEQPKTVGELEEEDPGEESKVTVEEDDIDDGEVEVDLTDDEVMDEIEEHDGEAPAPIAEIASEEDEGGEPAGDETAGDDHVEPDGDEPGSDDLIDDSVSEALDTLDGTEVAPEASEAAEGEASDVVEDPGNDPDPL